MLARILFFILFAYIAIVVFVYFAQRSLEYAPDRNHPGTPLASGLSEMTEVFSETEDGLRLRAWFAPAKEQQNKIIVMYHGNAGTIADRAHKARAFIDAGYGVYLCEYRGFGGNGGNISEEGFYEDARSAIHWLMQQGYKISDMIIYGESIGSGPAVQMAMDFEAPYLVLDAPFTSAVDVAKHVYFWLPVDFLMKDRYDNLSKISKVKSSLLVLHGEKDRVVPFKFGQALFDAANHPKQFVIFKEGGHSDLYDFGAGDAILKWLKEHDAP